MCKTTSLGLSSPFLALLMVSGTVGVLAFWLYRRKKRSPFGDIGERVNSLSLGLLRVNKRMSFSLRSVKVPPNSASLEEARSRVFDFFREACRSIPSVIDMYNLDDVVTVSRLRSTIASEIRKNSHVTDPKVLLSLALSRSLLF